MFRRKHDNKAIDLIGKRLVENDVLSIDEIDQVVGKIDLFDKVTRRIGAFAEEAGSHQPRKGGRWVPAMAGVVASLAIFTVLAAAFLGRFESGAPSQTFSYVQDPEVVPEAARPAVPPIPVYTKPSVGRAAETAVRSRIAGRIEKAAYGRNLPRTGNSSRASSANRPKAEFYPVAYTGDPAETAGGGRIIRVDMDRSALFALGLNMPLENDTATVRADLLVGMDGVTRAIRLVD